MARHDTTDFAGRSEIGLPGLCLKVLCFRQSKVLHSGYWSPRCRGAYAVPARRIVHRAVDQAYRASYRRAVDHVHRAAERVHRAADHVHRAVEPGRRAWPSSLAVEPGSLATRCTLMGSWRRSARPLSASTALWAASESVLRVAEVKPLIVS
jgi:hypothetical protein